MGLEGVGGGGVGSLFALYSSLCSTKSKKELVFPYFIQVECMDLQAVLCS